MKKIKKVIYRHYRQEAELEITKVVHELPTWMFPESIGGPLKTPCPVCFQEMRMNISHGQFIEICSMIQVNGNETMPIHTKCYFQIADS